MKTKSIYHKEADLCAAFIKKVPDSWTVYPETNGFDIFLVRKSDGFQIGIEAKLRLSAKVISQAAENVGSWYVDRENPDCRAVLVPERCGSDLREVCALLGISVIRMYEPSEWNRSRSFYPELPNEKSGYWDDEKWFQLCPAERMDVPDYIPDVSAGHSSPVALTDWKIRAIKLAITMEKRGFLCRQDFKHFQVSMSRWICPYSGWLIKDGRGVWLKGPHLPDFKAQHPVNYGEIEADYEIWRNKEEPKVQGKLL